MVHTFLWRRKYAKKTLLSATALYLLYSQLKVSDFLFTPSKLNNLTRNRYSSSRRWVIFPGRRQPSIVTVNELNYCVRNGNRCTLVTINTYLLSCEQESMQRKLYRALPRYTFYIHNWKCQIFIFTPSKLNNLTRNRYSSSRLHLIL